MSCDFRNQLLNITNNKSKRSEKSMLETYNDIMTVEDVCESLLIGKNAAYQLLNQGSIKAFRIGSRWKIPRASVIEYILRSRQG